MEAPRTDRILVVEDDGTIAEVVAQYLLRDGYQVETVADGLEAMERIRVTAPDLVILDLMLPGIDGMEVCRRLRATSTTPVLMLTARTSEEDRIIGLDVGADDYLAKPFSPRELVARVRALLRRARTPALVTGAGEPGVLRAGDLLVDVAAHEVRRDGELRALTNLEFDLLVHLMRHPRQVLSREQLLEGVWSTSFGDGSTVTVHIRRLREKIEDDPSRPRWITTVWGVGYRFDP